MDEDLPPGEKIRDAREKRGWSQADLARRIGISQPAVNKIEHGDTRQSKFFPQIARLLAMDLSDLIPSLNARSRVPDPAVVIPKEALVGGRDWPVYAAAQGGPGELLVSTDPVDFMPRPVPVQNVREAYGLIITGTSMEPEYRSGDTAIVNPNLPVEADTAYVFYSERHGEAKATLKHLRRATRDQWQVSQWNPPSGQPRDFTLPRREWAIAHRVLGKFSRR